MRTVLTGGLIGTFLKKVQSGIIQTDGAIIAGLFVLLATVFQSQPQSLSAEIRSWIIGITAPTVFPFVASIMLLTFFGFAPDKWPLSPTSKSINVPKWPAKMGILLMVFGFV